MPSPIDALRTLMSGPAKANDFVPLRAMQEGRLGDMTHNLELEQKFPGRVYSGATPSDVKDLSADIQNDPYTGQAQQDQTANIDTSNLKAILSGYTGNQDIATHVRPNGRIDEAMSVGGAYPAPSQQAAMASSAAERYKEDVPIRQEMSKAGEQRKTASLFAELQAKLNGTGGQAPPPSVGGPSMAVSHGQPAGPQSFMQGGTHSGKSYMDEQGNVAPQQAAPAPAQAPTDGVMSNFRPKPEFKMTMSPTGGMGMSQLPERQLNAVEQKQVDGLRESYRMMQEANNILQEQGVKPIEPGGKMPGFLGQLGAAIKAKSMRELYGAGFSDPTLSGDPEKASRYNKLTQLIENAKLQATAGNIGAVRNMEWIKQIQQHVMNGTQPDQVQMDRIKNLMEQYPKQIRDIYESRSGSPLQLLTPEQ